LLRSSELKSFQQIYSLMFVKDSIMVILFEKGHQYDAEEEEDNKIQGLTKKNPASWTRHQNLGNWIRFMLIKVEIHT
jgi:hypothetical protein